VVSAPTSNSAALFTSLPPNAAFFQSTLSELLADETFLPDGGLLGFDLFHEYPLAATGSDDEDELVRIAEVLKGSDAAAMQACCALGLHYSLNVGYADWVGDRVYKSREGCLALCKFVPDLQGEILYERLTTYLRKMDGVILVNSEFEDGNKEEIVLDKHDYMPDLDAFVHWVTEGTSHNMIESHNIFTDCAYYDDSESSFFQYHFGRICLIVDVGRPGSRGNSIFE